MDDEVYLGGIHNGEYSNDGWDGWCTLRAYTWANTSGVGG